jgi:predicted nucleic-acid-binding protein
MKVGVDTNVLVRYLTQDDAPQAKAVDRFLDDALAAGTLLRVSCIVLCELVWVLESLYRYDKRAVLAALDALAAVQQLEIEDRDQTLLAIEDFRSGRAQFADYLVGRRNLAAGCAHTSTFDKKLAGSPAFRVLR